MSLAVEARLGTIVVGKNQPHFPNGFLFNDPDHLDSQTDSPLMRLSLQHPLTGQAMARCAFVVRDGVGYSPAAAPFGSIEFGEDVSPDELIYFVDALVEEVRQAGCQRIRLVNYPNCYAPTQTNRLIYALTESGFNLVANTPTQYVPVSDAPLTTRMHPSERQRLRKAQRAGLVASRWDNPCVETVVKHIQKGRAQQGYPLTIQSEYLSRLLRQFSHEFPVFVVRDGDSIAALCVCVRVRYDILYTFLPVSHPDYRTLSPMVLLIDHLYQYSQHTGVDLLDLGTSLDSNREHKPSLAQFKQNMGAVESPKLTFELKLM